MLASGKGASGAKTPAKLLRTYATVPITAPSPRNGNGNGKQKHAVQEDAHVQRELFLNVLNANATKRDAKQYLARFQAPKPANPVQESDARHRRDQDRLERLGVNLGGLYEPARSIAQTPKFTQHHRLEKTELATGKMTHVALVSLRDPEGVDDATLDGLATTICQLVKLDMKIVLVSPVGDDGFQGERLEAVLTRHNPAGACIVTGALETRETDTGASRVAVTLPKLVLSPLKRGIVPIVPDLAYTPFGQQKQVANGDVMVALTEQLSGLNSEAFGKEAEKPSNQTKLSLDRIIMLDPEGGVPSSYRGGGRHVFVNLEQEYNDIEYELRTEPDRQGASSAFATGNHLDNLKVAQRCLVMLPSASSALIIAPEEAASSSQAKKGDSLGTGTRPQKNTLIHNLLTNKPTVSSSLPVARMPSGTNSPSDLSPSTATLLKRGMPLTIIPHTTRGVGWRTPPTGATPLNLAADPQVDFPRLLHLIENSFRRKLNVQHYLSRIANRTAGLIVAGNYEGCALLTYEQPPHTTCPSRLVPYLDKFAVLQSSQGSSGVADIVFQAMVRTCFPRGVCWRSRQDNPVNKWYFERCAGSWRIPGSQWTMFWTGEGVVDDEERWADFVGVCRGVLPSWADGGRPD